MIDENAVVCITIDDRKIIVKGIGKLFYQEGFPIPMAVSRCAEKGMEVSVFHVADELLKNGWKCDKVHQRLEAELKDIIKGDIELKVNWDLLRRFCYASYEDQRDIMFNSLFPSKNKALEWLRGYYIQPT